MARLGWSAYRDFGQTHTTNHFSRIPDALDVCVRHSNLETHEQTATGKVHKIPAAGIETSARVNSHLSVIGTNWWYQSAVLLARTSRDMLWRIWWEVHENHVLEWQDMSWGLCWTKLMQNGGDNRGPSSFSWMTWIDKAQISSKWKAKGLVMDNQGEGLKYMKYHLQTQGSSCFRNGLQHLYCKLIGIEILLTATDLELSWRIWVWKAFIPSSSALRTPAILHRRIQWMMM